ncbi:MAG: iron-containing alcohol dehydrogenase [candidate division WOR-3 bacterium]
MIRGIYIIGLPGSHKYKIAKYLEDWLNWEILNLQEEVEKSLHKTFIQIIEEKQLKTFEQEQEKYILSHISSGEIFISSDIIPKPETILKLRENGILCVYLNYSFETLEKEIERNQKLSPFLKIHPYNQYQEEIEKISEFLIKVPAEGFKDRELAIMIVRALKKEYDLIFSNSDKVYEGINSIHYLDELIDYEGFENALFITYKKLFLINFKWVFEVIKKSYFEPYVFFLPEKEEIKELDWVKRIWSEIIDLKIEKNTVIVAMGGGSSLDLVSFSTSTFRRGFPFISIPTTFISQIDASIGGRNSLHYLSHKNILGTTYYPRFILIDPVFILGLDDEKFFYSLIDAIKYGLLFDETILNYLEEENTKIKQRYLPTIENLVRRCALIKLNVCNRDPYGWSERRILEFGNTIANIIQETLHFNYQKALTVSIYLILKYLYENSILKEKQIFERIKNLLEIYCLNYELGKDEIEKILKRRDLTKFQIIGIETYRSPIPISVTKEEFFK